MNIIQAQNYDQLSKIGAAVIAGQILAKPDSILGLATGSTPEGTYKELVSLHRQNVLDFGKVSSFNLDEYYGIKRSDPQSYYAFMYRHLFSHVNIPGENIRLPNGEAQDADAECKAYEKLIAASGGIDLQLLGIGANGHIGFNEPGDVFPAVTHHVSLSESTIIANSRFYSSREEVPRSALTMGIGTIMAAKRILLLVSGAAKKSIMEQALYGPVTPNVPASVLQFHRDVTVVYDF
ncbi:MAG: glucosamine-6-phosphate deaminase [Oscillospiraceae bacterium]|nr:glucosamine-6-phosphate deaminase [Oscillospiraceae bacterium]